MLCAMAADIIEYASRDLRSSEGGFYSAEDADSLPSDDSTEKKEGAFYTWTGLQLGNVLGMETAEVFAFHFGVKLAGNCDATQDPEGQLTGQVKPNITCLRRRIFKTSCHVRMCCIRPAPLKRLETGLGSLTTRLNKCLTNVS